MRDFMHHVSKAVVLFLCGGAVYVALEMLCRGHSHWTMAIVGGLCFLLIGSINEFIPWEMPLLEQGVIGAMLVTAVEFASGLILNVWLQLNIWDYSAMPLNLMGQVCLPFSILWVCLSMCAVILDDWLRYKLFGEDRPAYRMFKRGTKK